MIVLNFIHGLTDWLPSITHWNDSVLWLNLMEINSQNVDVLRDIQNAWNTFIKSGQVWALGIGLVLGYMFRGLTA